MLSEVLNLREAECVGGNVVKPFSFISTNDLQHEHLQL